MDLELNRPASGPCRSGYQRLDGGAPMSSSPLTISSRRANVNRSEIDTDERTVFRNEVGLLRDEREARGFANDEDSLSKEFPVCLGWPTFDMRNCGGIILQA